MNILALDPATKTGWALSPELSGTWDCSIKKDESDKMRLVRLRAKLNTLKEAYPGIDTVVYEAARNVTPGRAIVVHSELQSVIKLWCHDNDIAFIGVSPVEIKKFATGAGNAKKDKMIAAAKAKWPDVNIVDDNHADALWILAFGQDTLK